MKTLIQILDVTIYTLCVVVLCAVAVEVVIRLLR